MAFNTPPTFALITQPIGIQGIQIWSYQTDDPISEVMVAGYFTDVATWGAHIGDMILCVASDGTNSFAVSLTSIDVAGDGTAEHVEDFPIATEEEAEEGTTNIALMTPLRTQQAITAQRYDTWADAQAATIPVDVNTIYVGGHTVAGRGSGVFKRVSPVPSHAAKFVSADGGCWELAEDEVTPEMLGAVGDGVADDTTPVLNAWNFLVYRNTGLLRSIGRYNLASAVEVDRTTPDAFIMHGDGIDSAMLANAGGGLKFSSTNARAYFFGQDLVIEPAIDGAGTLLDIDYSAATRFTGNTIGVRLDHIKLGPKSETGSGLSATNALTINNATRPKLTDVWAFPNAAGSAMTLGIDLPENYYPMVLDSRIVGKRGDYGLRLQNLTHDTEGLRFNGNSSVGFDYGMWVERAQGQAPVTDIINNYVANFRENIHIDGAKFGFILNNYIYEGGAVLDGEWDWSQSGLTLTLTAGKPHDLTTANYVTVTCTGAGTTWLNNTGYVIGDQIFNESVLYVCTLNHTSPVLPTAFATSQGWTSTVPITTVPPSATTLAFTMKTSMTGSGSVVHLTDDGDFYDINIVNGSGFQIGPNLFAFNARKGHRHVRLEPGGPTANKPVWIAGTYTTDDFVTSGVNGRVYKCAIPHLSAVDPGTSVAAPAWVTATAYIAGNPVQASDGGAATATYTCLVAHTASANFADDLHAATPKWLEHARDSLWLATSVRDIRVGPDLLLAGSDIAPYYVGPGCENVFIHLPYFVPSSEGSYPGLGTVDVNPSRLVEVDPLVDPEQVLIRDDLDVLLGWQDIAANVSTDINSLPSKYIQITNGVSDPFAGAAGTINNFGYAPVGRTKWVKFKNTLVTIRHNTGAIILPGNANILTEAGDKAQFVCIAGGPSASIWECLTYTRQDTAPP